MARVGKRREGGRGGEWRMRSEREEEEEEREREREGARDRKRWTKGGRVSGRAGMTEVRRSGGSKTTIME